MLLMVTSFTLSAQTKTVSGTVYDEKNVPVIGASIMEETSGAVVSTDIDGKYTIEVPEGGSVKVLYMGYQEQVLAVGEQSTLDVVLAPEENMLEEIVLDALGFERKTDKLGQAVSQVKATALVSSGEASVANAMQGKMAGVRINRSNGDPGSASNIRIRGANTITGSSQPLIVVDGIPISNSSRTSSTQSATGNGSAQQSRLTDINPNDIASMQVLKGASAAALWGSRASNGVILITTKSGKKGLKVNYKAQVQFDEVLKALEVQRNYGRGDGGKWKASSIRSWGDKLADRPGGTDEYNTSGGYFVPQGKVNIEENRIYPVSKKNSKTDYYDQNFDQVFGTGFGQDHTISLSGGNEEGTIYFGIGWLDQEGIIRNNTYQRFTANLNATRKFNDYVKLNIKGKYSNVNANRIQQNSNVAGLLLGLYRTPVDFDNRYHIGTYYNDKGAAFPNRHRSYRNPIGASDNGRYNNPRWTTDEQKNLNEVNRYIFSSEIDIFPVKNWNIKLRGGIDGNSDERRDFLPAGSSSSSSFALRKSGALTIQTITEREINFDVISKFDYEITPGITSSFVAGWNINDRESEVVDILAGKAITSAEKYNLINFVEFIPRNSIRKIRSNRGYSTLNLGFEDQLFVDLTGALEAASTISKPFFYPAASVAWQVSNASFFPENDVLTFAKLRASWGQVGVQPQAYRFSTDYEGNFRVTDGGFTGLNIQANGGGLRLDNSKGNQNLRPEIKTEIEVGLETRWLDNAINSSMTFYTNNVEDVLLTIDRSPSAGFTSEYVNGAKVSNFGFEFELSANLLKGNKDFTFTPYLNWSMNRNEVTDLQGAEKVDLIAFGTGSSVAVKGESIGMIWGGKILRDKDGNPIHDANGFYQKDEAQGVIGDPTPDWTGGFGFRAGWKGLNLNVLFEHSQGGKFYSMTKQINMGRGHDIAVGNEVVIPEDGIKDFKGNVYKKGDVVRGNLADHGKGTILLNESWYRGIGASNRAIAELLLEDATWTRLREVSLSYSIPSDILEPFFISGATVGVTGRNLFLWTDSSEDPDMNFAGVSNGRGLSYYTNPSTKTYLFNVSLTF